MKRDFLVQGLDVTAFEIPTESPESDGTAEWKSTTIVIVEVHAADTVGCGYTYADRTTAELIRSHLKPLIVGADAMNIEERWIDMVRAVRNLGRSGIAAMAISAVDCALWDLKARLLKLPLVTLLGQVREATPVYGSGGFTSYTNQKLAEQLNGWVAEGIGSVKMKIGRNPAQDLERIRIAREAINDDTTLMIDANGAFSAKAAARFAGEIARWNVQWFEEPVSSDDLEGLRLLRSLVSTNIEVAAGEYGYDPIYFRRMLEAQAVDVLQADATRCGGFTGFMKANTLAEAFQVPLSSHCAPALHMHVDCACSAVRHSEYFFDHVRIEKMLFEGVTEATAGEMRPSLELIGNGLQLKRPVVHSLRAA